MQQKIQLSGALLRTKNGAGIAEISLKNKSACQGRKFGLTRGGPFVGTTLQLGHASRLQPEEVSRVFCSTPNLNKHLLS